MLVYRLLFIYTLQLSLSISYSLRAPSSRNGSSSKGNLPFAEDLPLLPSLDSSTGQVIPPNPDYRSALSSSFSPSLMESPNPMTSAAMMRAKRVTLESAYQAEREARQKYNQLQEVYNQYMQQKIYSEEILREEDTKYGAEKEKLEAIKADWESEKRGLDDLRVQYDRLKETMERSIQKRKDAARKETDFKLKIESLKRQMAELKEDMSTQQDAQRNEHNTVIRLQHEADDISRRYKQRISTAQVKLQELRRAESEASAARQRRNQAQNDFDKQINRLERITNIREDLKTKIRDSAALQVATKAFMETLRDKDVDTSEGLLKEIERDELNEGLESQTSPSNISPRGSSKPMYEGNEPATTEEV